VQPWPTRSPASPQDNEVPRADESIHRVAIRVDVASWHLPMGEVWRPRRLSEHEGPDYRVPPLCQTKKLDNLFQLQAGNGTHWLARRKDAQDSWLQRLSERSESNIANM